MKIEHKTISVIIPAFNAEKTIERALSSILHQDFLPDEIIIIDDGSTDNTAQIAKQHAVVKKIPTFVISKTNKGVSIARNLGILAASSDYIALLDADDEFCQTHIRSMKESIESYPQATLYFASSERCFDNNSEVCQTEKNTLPDFSKIALQHWPTNHQGNSSILNTTLFEDLLKGNFIPLSTAVFPRKIDGELMEFKNNLSYGEDRDFLIRLISKGSALFINQTGGIIHRDGTNVSSLGNSARNSLRKFESLIEISCIDFVKQNEKYSAIVKNCLDTSSKSYIYHASFDGVFSFSRSLKRAVPHISVFSLKNISFIAKNTVRSLFFSARNLHKKPLSRRPAS